MWPWGHLVIGYVIYSLLGRVRSIRLDGYAVFLVVLGTQFPDLVDKPLAWTLQLLPSGRSLAHSLVFAVPVVIVVSVYYYRRGSLSLATGFTVGYISHLITDGIYYISNGEFQYYAYLLWPFVPQPSYPTSGSFIAHMLQIEPDPYFLLQLVIVACTAALWVWDETPGISAGSAKVEGREARTSSHSAWDDLTEGNEEQSSTSSLSDTPDVVPTEGGDSPIVSIILPTLNEEHNISQVLTQLEAVIEKMGITTEIIVADNSTDDTPQIASNHGARVVTPDSMGYGYACKFASAYAQGDFVVFSAGNAAYEFQELSDLLEPLIEGEFDISIGNRFGGSIRSGTISPFEYLGNKLLALWLRIFYGISVQDVGSKFRAITRESLDEINLTSTHVEFGEEMLVEADGRNKHIAEIPITYVGRDGERNLDIFQNIWRHVRFILLNASGYLFLIPGIIFIASGVILLPLSVANIQLLGVTFDVHFLLLSSALLIGGYQLIALSVFARVTGNSIRLPRDPNTKWIVKYIQLRHVATMGIFLLGAGSTYLLYAFEYWLANNDLSLTILFGDIIAVTSLILGGQMIISSFYLSFQSKSE